MANTSGYNPGSPTPTGSPAMSPKKKQSGGGKKGTPVRLGTKKKTATKRLPSSRNRKDPPKDPTQSIMPTLRRSEPAGVGLRRSGRIRTPAPSPPKVLFVPGELPKLPPLDLFHPLDHTNHQRSPADMQLLKQAAAQLVGMNSKDGDDISNASSESRRTVGEKGSISLDVDDDTDGGSISHADDNDTDDGDPTYKPPADLNDDDLFYSDDEVLDAAFDRGLDEVARTIEYSDPKTNNHGRRRTTIIAGGPQPPDYTGMDDKEKEDAKGAYEVKRKAYCDKMRRQRLKSNVNDNTFSVATYTGCLHPVLRPMSVVEAHRLRLGHTFPSVDLLKLRVAEEANLRGISCHIARSEIRQFRCYGYKFIVEANNTEYAQGFVVTFCSVRNGDDYTNLPEQSLQFNVEQEKYCSPFKTSMIAPLILGMIADNPGCTNKTLRGFLKMHGKEYALTEPILQKAKTAARTQLFGTPEVNVTFANSVKLELEQRGHIVRMEYTERRQTLKNIEVIVISEELLRLKHLNNSTMDKDERLAYISKWKKDHRELLMAQLGPKECNVSFLHGIFFSPSFSQATVPELQRLVMADACHLHFGKYTLYSMYGITANANMFPVGFAIIFGNENLLGWQSFLKFIIELHPCLNKTDVTIVSDQDKGLFSAIAEEATEAVNFHCSYHRSQNILKMCGGGKKGTKQYSAIWVYNRLLQCRTLRQIERVKDKYFNHMDTRDLQYLNSLPDESQYPAARCALTPGVYMYHRTSSAAIESMNAANREMRAKTAVDPLNACILLLRMECKRFVKQRNLAWAMDTELTSRGKVEYDEVFSNIFSFDFRIAVSEDEYGYICTVRRNINSQTREGGTVTIVKEPNRGSYFGKCTCGVDTRDGVPCEHMAALVISSKIPMLTRENIMPYWWRTDHLQLQFPKDVTVECNVSMETIREDGIQNPNKRYCPSWSAPNKSGRPKKTERRKSVLEKAGVTKVAKKPKLMMTFCQLCHGGSHVANECWELEKNSEKRPEGWKSVLDKLEDAWDTLSSGGGGGG